MNERKSVIVIGSGAGGAMAAKELQEHFDVTILEEGKEFRPFAFPVEFLAKFRKTGVFLDERMIQVLFPNMRIRKTDDMVMVNGRGVGGTTTLATGNAVRYGHDLKAIGIDLDNEFKELYEELPITTDHQKRWNAITREMFSTFEDMGFEPVVTPKLLYADKCINCGQCAIGCKAGAKWDSRTLVDESLHNGARLIKGCKVTDLEIIDGEVRKVNAITNGKKQTYEADFVVLAAGGFGTPVILENSGIQCEKTLFVDPVLCVAAPWKGAKQAKQLLMPFITQHEKYILSPYMDYLSFFFNKDWRMPLDDMVSLMIKMADEESGGCTDKKIEKNLTESDKKILQGAVALCKDILIRMGVDEEDIFLGTVNAGHPGGMLPLTADEKDTLHSKALPDNLYVADATIIPKAMGNPPMLVIMALAKKIAKVIYCKLMM